MRGDEKLFFAPDMTLAEIRRRWPDGKLENDCVRRFAVEITGHYGFIVSPYIEFAKEQPIGLGYVTTGNVGFIIQRVAKLLDLFEDDTRDFGKAIENCPLRIYSWGHAGDNHMKTICIGHFMKDRFIHGFDLILTGLPLELAAKQQEGGAE